MRPTPHWQDWETSLFPSCSLLLHCMFHSRSEASLLGRCPMIVSCIPSRHPGLSVVLSVVALALEAGSPASSNCSAFLLLFISSKLEASFERGSIPFLVSHRWILCRSSLSEVTASKIRTLQAGVWLQSRPTQNELVTKTTS